MTDFRTADLLVELGCEELPPRSLDRLSGVFFDGVCRGLEAAGIQFDQSASRPFHTPRRLALMLAAVADRQPDRVLERKGPALGAAFDSDGAPTKAALGFARSVGREVTALETVKTDQGEWLYCRVEEPGKSLQELLFPILQSALEGLPVSKPMRWSDNPFSFVRPVHWLVVLHGDAIVEGSLFGKSAGRDTFGHRIHGPGPHEIARAGDYQTVLGGAQVLVDPVVRRARIAELAVAAGAGAGGVTRITDALLDEVCNLVEWPVAVTCHFEQSFLEVPAEALIASMEDHQKFFPVLGEDDQKLKPVFVAMSNIESTAPDQVRSGYEKVIRPRLADARFFWEQDRKRPLEEGIQAIDGIIFHKKLGTIGDKSKRIAIISENLAGLMGLDTTLAVRAAALCKCDLVSQMVGEFPELQGIMGGYYAGSSGEDPAVCTAISEHYQPRFAGDSVPGSPHGQVLSLSDRLDTLLGIFSIGLEPTGNKDPFALRRAALGAVRILLENDIRIPLDRLLAVAATAWTQEGDITPGCLKRVREFILDRTKNHFRDQGFSAKLVNAVLGAPVTNLPDLQSRLMALKGFMELPAAGDLVAANKRIGNILRKSKEEINEKIEEDKLIIEAEKLLFDEVNRLENTLEPLYEASEYPPALTSLAELRVPLSRFFDDVMVMDEDPLVRRNRLALLGRLKGLFDRVADLSMAA